MQVKMDSSFLIGATGTLLGVGAGAAANLLRNGGSLLAKGTLESCKDTPFLGNTQLQAINNFREVSVPAAILVPEASKLTVTEPCCFI